MCQKSGKISVIDGENYLNKIGPKLRSYLANSATGIFPTSVLDGWRNIAGFSGLMFWYCYGPFNQGPRKVLYLAVEPKFEFTYEKNDPAFALNLKPENPKLLLPLEIRGKAYTGNNGSRVMVKETGRPQVVPIWREQSIVNAAISDFLKEFQSFNKYAHGYLIKQEGTSEDYFESLFGVTNSSPEFIRYYFGFDESSKPCHFRFFLVPVNSKGENILKSKLEVSGSTTTESYLLQKSWPPPPNS